MLINGCLVLFRQILPVNWVDPALPQNVFCFLLEETFKGSQQPSSLSLSLQQVGLKHKHSALSAPPSTEHIIWRNAPQSSQDFVTSDPNQMSSCWCDQGVHAKVSYVLSKVTYQDMQTCRHRYGGWRFGSNIPRKITVDAVWVVLP